MSDLARIAGPDWVGWYFERGELFAPEFRRGFTPGELRAIPYMRQCMSELSRRLDAEHREHAAVVRLMAFYRRQLTLESRLGLMLTALAR